MTRTVKAAALSDAIVKDQRLATVTGRIQGTWSTTTGTAIILHLPPDATVDIHPA